METPTANPRVGTRHVYGMRFSDGSCYVGFTTDPTAMIPRTRATFADAEDPELLILEEGGGNNVLAGRVADAWRASAHRSGMRIRRPGKMGAYLADSEIVDRDAEAPTGREWPAFDGAPRVSATEIGAPPAVPEPAAPAGATADATPRKRGRPRKAAAPEATGDVPPPCPAPPVAEAAADTEQPVADDTPAPNAPPAAAPQPAAAPLQPVAEAAGPHLAEAAGIALTLPAPRRALPPRTARRTRPTRHGVAGTLLAAAAGALGAVLALAWREKLRP